MLDLFSDWLPPVSALRSRVATALSTALVACFASRAGAATLSDQAATTFELEAIASGLSLPTDIAILPDGRSVVTQRLGDVAVVDSDGTILQAGHIDVLTPYTEQGLLGVVADPDFDENRTLYFYASVDSDPNNKHQVLKVVLNEDGTLSDDRRAIVDMGLRGPANHNGGGLVIHGGQLYFSVGDTGGGATPPKNKFATCLNVPNGKIIRVNLDGSTPEDNPLVGLTAVTGCPIKTADFELLPPDTRIYAWGLRNPWRFWIDEQTGLLWIGDVGSTTREEISLGGKGTHFGYPFWEGSVEYSQDFKPPEACRGLTPARPCTPPVFDYPHAENNVAVIGGLIPHGCGWTAPWSRRYFFADYGSGQVWTLNVTPNRRAIQSNSRLTFAQTNRPVSIRMGLDALYIVEYAKGVIDRVRPKSLDAGACPPDEPTVPDASVPSDAAIVVDAAPSSGGQSGDASNGGRSSDASNGGRSSDAGRDASGAGGSVRDASLDAEMDVSLGDGGELGAGGRGRGGVFADAPVEAGGVSSIKDAGPDASSGVDSDGGCGCRLTGEPRGANRSVWALVFAAAVLGLRRSCNSLLRGSEL